MTARELVDLIDKKATLYPFLTPGSDRRQDPNLVHFGVAVQIIDAKEHFGRIDVLVTPESGEGQAWVSADRVKVRGK